MNGWPPKPVCTLMTSSMSISPRYGATASNGVSGSNESPARIPSARISSNSGRGSPSSMWTVQPSAPASANAGEQHLRVVDHQVAVEEQLACAAATTSRPAARS